MAVLEKVAAYGRIDKKQPIDFDEAAEREEAAALDANGVEEPVEVEESVAENSTMNSAEEEPEAKRIKMDKVPEKKEKNKNVAWTSITEDPFVFLNPESDTLVEAKALYGFNNGFPMDQFVVRTETDRLRSIYFVSKAVKRVLQASNSKRIKVLHVYKEQTCLHH